MWFLHFHACDKNYQWEKGRTGEEVLLEKWTQPAGFALAVYVKMMCVLIEQTIAIRKEMWSEKDLDLIFLLHIITSFESSSFWLI